ncbi:MAG: Zn-dependent hydrolase [Rhodospirillaceae bacterium]|jgi:beta-ureidopropionase / N-carbamoyl-L-amino-acid hydrolase|nr:Zn-dependent hydrolase [Rhodospirillaceae bacterium]MBT6140297.1 Zn-dependent hydrolase [Rhodospirillaceae bacterium]
MRNIKTDMNRLWDSLMEMGSLGETDKGGVNRLTLTDLDRQSRDLFKRWCEEAGCTVTVDGVGNMFARRPGRDPNRKPVVSGSHLDTQPTGGKFDGAYGVLGALEVVRTLNDAGVETEAPIEVAVWTNEEGSRFSPAMMGSGAFAGVFGLDEVMTKQDSDGTSFGEALSAIGYDGEAAVGNREFDSYFEAHIEQGPKLEAAGLPVGIVTDAQGQRWLEVTVTGVESHAGPTPMEIRKDALVGASRMIHLVNQVGMNNLPNACATCGVIESFPNSRNVIPGRVFFTIDFRHPNDAILAKMDHEFKQGAAEIAEEIGLELDIKDFWYFPPTPFDADCVDAVRKGAELHGHGSMDIISGAGHDAVYMAGLCPTGMIFVPCENGISHNELERASKEDLSAGCDVLLHAMLDRATRT